MTWVETLRHLDYCPSGGNHRTVKKYARLWEVDTSHFDPNLRRRTSSRHNATPLKEVLVRGSSYSRQQLKRRLYREGLKERRCEMCGQGEDWKGRKMSLILDHINGERDDHRLENLRIVCPNCAATLPTHCGRHKLTKPRPLATCEGCGERFRVRFRNQKFCTVECGQRAGRIVGEGLPNLHLRRAERPPYSQLMAEIETTSYCAVGRKYGVSDVAVRKWVRFYERQRELEARRDEDGGGEGERAA